MIFKPACNLALALAFFVLAACETVSAPTEMDPLAFDAALAQAQSLDNPVTAERQLSDLLEVEILGDQQRARLLFERAKRRWTGAIDKPGAIDDLKQSIALRPEAPINQEVTRNIADLSSEVADHQARLAGLQNQSDWFDDTVALGQMKVAADRYRQQELTPNPAQAYLLREAGYICAGADTAAAVHKHQPVPEHVEGLIWCPQDAIS